LILEKSTSRSLSPARINPHKTVVKDVLSEDDEAVVEDAEEEVEVVAVDLSLETTTTTTKEEETTITTTTKVPTTITTTTKVELAITTMLKEETTTDKKDVVSLVADSEEVEVEAKVTTAAEIKEDKEVLKTNPEVPAKEDKDQEMEEVKVVPATKAVKAVKVVKVVLPEEDALPDANCPTELHRPPLCSWPISHSNSMMKVSPSCSKIRK